MSHHFSASKDYHNLPENQTLSDKDIEEQVKAGNAELFMIQNLSQRQACLAFTACCRYKKKFSFTNLILKFKPTNVVGTCLYYDQDALLCEIFDKYKMSLVGLSMNVMVNHIVAWSQDSIHFSVFEKIIEIMPNHTKKVLHNDKCSGVEDQIYYSHVYNRILNRMLTSQYNIPMKAFELLAQKKFPINHDNANLIINKKHPVFSVLTDRLKNASKVETIKPHIAQHEILISENYGVLQGKLTPEQIKWHKHVMLKELKQDLPIPDYIFRQLKNYPYDNGAHTCVMPDDRTYKWIDKIGKKKPYVLSFINRHFYYDKVKFYQQLNNDINHASENHESGHCKSGDNNLETLRPKMKI